MRMTMGAMLRFKRETDRDVSEIGTDVSLMVTFLFCCVASACNADGVAFDLDIDKFAERDFSGDHDKFADGLGMDMLNEFAETMQEDVDESKKKPETISPQTLTN